MLKPAQLYKEELEKLFLRTWYDLKYMFYIGWTSKLKKIGILSILNGNPSGYDYSYCDYELCRECTKELNDFLRKR